MEYFICPCICEYSLSAHRYVLSWVPVVPLAGLPKNEQTFAFLGKEEIIIRSDDWLKLRKSCFLQVETVRDDVYELNQNYYFIIYNYSLLSLSEPCPNYDRITIWILFCHLSLSGATSLDSSSSIHPFFLQVSNMYRKIYLHWCHCWP